jgi:hypothetical protein
MLHTQIIFLKKNCTLQNCSILHIYKIIYLPFTTITGFTDEGTEPELYKEPSVKQQVKVETLGFKPGFIIPKPLLPEMILYCLPETCKALVRGTAYRKS